MVRAHHLMSLNKDSSSPDGVSSNINSINNVVEFRKKNKRCYLIEDEIDSTKCNELIMEYLDYMGMASTLVAFRDELSLSDKNVSCYSGKLDSIFSLIMNCDIFEALKLVESVYKDFVSHHNDLYVKILSLKFFQYIIESKLTEAVDFSQQYFIRYIEGENKNEFIEDILMLLAFEDPNCSPNRHYLCQPYRSAVAHEVCVTVANHLQINPKTPDLTSLFRAIYFTENELESFRDTLTFIDDKNIEIYCGSTKENMLGIKILFIIYSKNTISIKFTNIIVVLYSENSLQIPIKKSNVLNEVFSEKQIQKEELITYIEDMQGWGLLSLEDMEIFEPRNQWEDLNGTPVRMKTDSGMALFMYGAFIALSKRNKPTQINPEDFPLYIPPK